MHKRAATRQTKTTRQPRSERRAADELDELIAYGRAALTAPGPAPLAMQLETALRVAALHMRRAERLGATETSDDIRWAATLATFAAHRCEDTPPAAVIELASRAVAILEMCAEHIPEIEAGPARELADRTRERINRAEQLVALSLDEAISSVTIARALLAHAPEGDAHDAVATRTRSLLASAAVAARRAGDEQLAAAALGLLPVASATGAAPPEQRARRGRRRLRA